jgi:hypothetical protein
LAQAAPAVDKPCIAGEACTELDTVRENEASEVDIGFIGLGHMGFPMARRLVDASHDVVAFDRYPPALERIAVLGAHIASSPREVADRAETILASLPTPATSLEVATERAGVIEGSRVKRYVDLSTVGGRTAVQIHDRLAQRDIAALDSPVSGGVGGASMSPRRSFESGKLPRKIKGPNRISLR